MQTTTEPQIVNLTVWHLIEQITYKGATIIGLKEEGTGREQWEVYRGKPGNYVHVKCDSKAICVEEADYWAAQRALGN